jgi:quercetin dioxygenase-like cupin family protein
MEPIVHRPGEGEPLKLGPSGTVIKVAAEQTGGAFYLGETMIPPGFAGPPKHIHEHMFDMFWVLEGTLTLHLEEESLAAEAGTFACVPPQNPHTFSNDTEAEVRFINIFTPAGFEQYLRDMSQVISRGGEVTPALMGELASRYDFKPV